MDDQEAHSNHQITQPQRQQRRLFTSCSQTISALHLADIWLLLGSLYFKRHHYLSAPNHLKHAVELQVNLQAKPRT